MKVVRRFVLIQGKKMAQYVDGKQTSIWDINTDGVSREEMLKAIEWVRLLNSRN